MADPPPPPGPPPVAPPGPPGWGQPPNSPPGWGQPGPGQTAPGWGPPGPGYAPPGWAPHAGPAQVGSGRFRAMGVGEFLDATFSMYRRNFLLIAAISALVQ